MRPGAAAEILGIERHQLDGYLFDNPEFAAQVADAEQDAVEHVEEALYQAAVSGNVAACKLWLERRPRSRGPDPDLNPEPGSPGYHTGGSLGGLIDDRDR